MSIIHDALKKVQQGQTPKADETPTDPATSNPPTSGYIYSTPTETAAQDDRLPIKHLPLSPKKAISVLALLCAIAITLGAFGFFFKQLNTHFPQVKRLAKSSFYQLIHKEEQPDFKTKTPEDLIPLAKITINPLKPLNPPGSTKLPVNIPYQNAPQTIDTHKVIANAPLTLNIHGVMSNGPNNLVLINDQVYQEGDEVDGAKIVKINMSSITVINNGKEETIRVKN